MELEKLRTLIHEAFEGKKKPEDVEVTQAIEQAIVGLDCGELRVCEKQAGQWNTNAWLKEAILLYFRIMKMKVIKSLEDILQIDVKKKKYYILTKKFISLTIYY